jgi:hypothetical protein
MTADPMNICVLKKTAHPGDFWRGLGKPTRCRMKNGVTGDRLINSRRRRNQQPKTQVMLLQESKSVAEELALAASASSMIKQVWAKPETLKGARNEEDPDDSSRNSNAEPWFMK